ncbi:Vaculolar membrane protein-domain-containing protein [Catenaria anguillulae PL171]|uniref:Vaculolar membrane protein-domain-containing protein n=1 Tax=Catenaria anguillulae PL171 TaxID=765915 RepID=A0A1Y2I0F3_9FUNG|nr:Vaculolar membrane protein-domain-containing protein [Catenaria anguillulae PL171]
MNDAAGNTVVDDPSGGIDDDPQCQLLDHFAIGVQLLMGCIVFLSMLLKRHRESPRRPWRIWFFDISKQGLGASFVHGLNVLVSLVAGSSPDSHSSNPCVFYFLNVGIDTTVGVYILYLWLQAAHRIVVALNVERDLKSGHYGTPPRAMAWVKQTLVFSMCLFMMKVCVAMFIYLFPWVQILGTLALAPFTDPRHEVVFVMLVFPIIMNVVQFWLVDQVIKHKTPTYYLPATPTFADEEGLDLFHSHDHMPASPPPALAASDANRGSNDSFHTEDYMSDTSLLTSPDVLGPHSVPGAGVGRPLSPGVGRPSRTKRFMDSLKKSLVGGRPSTSRVPDSGNVRYTPLNTGGSSGDVSLANTQSANASREVLVDVLGESGPEQVPLPGSRPGSPGPARR